MGDHQDGGAQIVDLLQQGHDLEGPGGVQVTGGLVGDDGGRVVHQGPGDGQSLLLAAGHLAGETVLLVLQADQLQHIGDPLPDLLLLGADDTHGEGHIVIDGHIGDQAEVLEHDADGAAQIGDLSLADPLQRVAVHMDAALGGAQLTGDQLDDGGLAGAGGAHQEAEFAVFDLHGNTVQSPVALIVCFFNISKKDHYIFSCPGAAGPHARILRSVTEF